ncbi:hypothetical protein MNBD_ALPHA07-1457 [hydrothermal vent metagenome]|uniref:Uncharacterized protein n=1 Tax=hydrothermal vent metagenome TaxID=652676 RepID=A0A3B0SFW4_9ZZZZ
MSKKRSSLLRAAPAYWACIAILAFMAGYFIATLTMGPSGSFMESLDIVVLFFAIAFAPGTFSLIVAAVALIFKKQPGGFLRIGAYITTIYYVVAYIMLNWKGLL